MINIAVFDDHSERREALKLLLSLQPDMACIGAYENCAYLVEDLKDHVPDVVLMDIDMPDVNGIQGVVLLRAHFPDTLIIMQTVFEDEDKIFRSIEAGANGYILKKALPQKLIDAIYDVLNGGAPMTSVIANKVLQRFRKQKPVASDEDSEDFNLTPRETEILSHLVKGYSHKMVAAELEISIFTVNNHIKKIYQKLQVRSASEVVIKAIQRGIVK